MVLAMLSSVMPCARSLRAWLLCCLVRRGATWISLGQGQRALSTHRGVALIP
jgi:hypothetical protein